MNFLITVLTILLAAVSAQAGDNSCFGVVHVDENQTTIVDAKLGNICRFATKSSTGRKILAKCPDGSTCFVNMKLPRNGDVSSIANQPMKNVLSVERMK